MTTFCSLENILEREKEETALFPESRTICVSRSVPMTANKRYIIYSAFLLTFLLLSGFLESRCEEEAGRSVSAFPILMYDTDIGVGYGAKAKGVDYLSRNESLDLILFNSTEGERWYVLTFCIPDIEIRQGKAYPFSLDIRAEYDRLLKNNFYGLGPGSLQKNLTNFTFEKKELQLAFGRGFSPSFVLEASYVFRNIRYFNIVHGEPYAQLLGTIGDQFSPFVSFLIRFDTSDSQIHPRKGFRLLLQDDLAAGFLGNKKASFNRFTLDFRKYLLILGERDVLAFRVLVQRISGGDVPLFEMSALGGGSTQNAMRGYAMNRFQDKGKILSNIEYRFPVWGKLGGNLFIDLGTVWPSFSRLEFRKMAIDAGWGLRYYLKNFLARFDMGFSREGMRIYFNFGQVF
jgi:outer membrane protein assembly factor BamA